MSIIVQPAEPGETLEKLLAKKRDLVEKLRQEKPEGKFGLKEDQVCQFKCVRIDTEFPAR